ncbi:MAG: putative motility protein [Rubripirellula sp.]
MSSIPAPVQQVLQARDQAMIQKIDMAVAKKALDTQKQSGDAIISMLEQTVNVQKQIANGHLDVRV